MTQGPKLGGGYQPTEPENPPVPPQGGTAVVNAPIAAAGDQAEKTDEELAAAAEEIADTAVALDAALQPQPGAPAPLLDPEDLAGRKVAGQPSTIHLEDAMQCWGLEPEDVLGWREVPEQELVIVTAGGRKLRWPDDEHVRLSDGERGRTVPPANRVFPSGYVRRDASKDPQD